MQQKLEERKYLNEQIMNHQRLLFQIFTFSVIAAIAVLGWSIQILSGNRAGSELAPFLLLAPTAIIISCAFVISAIRDDVFGWGAYIIVFHEQGEAAGYETALDMLRTKLGRFRESYTSIFGVYLVIILLCCLSFVIVILTSERSPYLIALVTIPLGFHVWWSVIYFNIPSEANRKKHRDLWQEAKETLSASSKHDSFLSM